MPLIHSPDTIERSARALHDAAARYETLAADLRRLAADTAPTPAELTAAPLLEGWRWHQQPVGFLVGMVQGHPRLPDGPVSTSPVIVHSPAHSWVRTVSRFYVLGQPDPQAGAPRRG